MIRICRYLRFVIIAFVMVFLVGPSVYCDDFKYESRGRRDPFVPLVGIDVPKASKLEDITSINDIKFEGVASGKRGKMVAILNGEIVKEGDRFGEIEIGKITKKIIIIKMGGKDNEIQLPEEGGSKSDR